METVARKNNITNKPEKVYNSNINNINHMDKMEKGDCDADNSHSITMIEHFIEKSSGNYKRRALWQHLPSKVAYPLYKQIIDYLIKSDKILIDNKGFVCWIPVSRSKKKYTYDERLMILEK
jgi:hypothetical protein